MERIIDLLCCLECKGNLSLTEKYLECKECRERYPIINGVPRFVPESFYDLGSQNNCIEEKTKNYFGYEWDHFNRWGFIRDEDIPFEKKNEFFGGTVSARKSAFDSKCRMSANDMGEGKIILDAGCGNGRYTYEASLRADGIVIGVDLGYGSVKSAYENNKEQDNVIILQASLFNLPFKNSIIDACFSNGVLMHTGDTKRAFSEVARTIKKEGVFIVHVYHKLNPVWEFNDKLIRVVTTRLDIDTNLKFAKILSKCAQKISGFPNLLSVINLFFRLQPTIIHMYDWYAAPAASHHTYKELESWFCENGFFVNDSLPEIGLIMRPWAVNLRGKKK